MGQTTVYRTLQLLTDAGLAREVRFGDGRAHYEHNYKHEHHDHMICSECGKIIEFYSPELEAIQDAMAAKYKFTLTEHLLRMIGVCADCQQKAEKPAGSQRTCRARSEEHAPLTQSPTNKDDSHQNIDQQTIENCFAFNRICFAGLVAGLSEQVEQAGGAQFVDARNECAGQERF